MTLPDLTSMTLTKPVTFSQVSAASFVPSGLNVLDSRRPLFTVMRFPIGEIHWLLGSSSRPAC